MRNLLQRIADAIRREPASFRQIEGAGQMGELPRNQQDQLLEKGQTERR